MQTDWVDAFAAALPEEKGGLYLQHNPHHAYHESVSEYLAHLEVPPDFPSPEERQRVLESGELWTLQWYPQTPIGSYELAASSLVALMQFVEESNP